MVGQPLPQGFVTRGRLRAALDEVVDAHVVVVSAPWGMGKTVLARDWAYENGIPAHIVWVGIDDGSRTSAGITTLLRKRLQQRRLLSDDAERLALHGAGAGVCIIVDDAHRLSNEAQGVLTEFIRSHSEALFVLLTRSSESIKRVIDAAGFGVRILDEDLAFTSAEITALCEANDVPQTGETIARLHELSAGRALDLHMLLLAEPAVHDDVSPGSIRARAGEKILQDLDQDDRRAALLLSLVPQADAELAGRVLCEDDASQRLERMRAAGLGVWHGGDEQRLLLHKHVRLALATVAESELDENERREALLSAGDVLSLRQGGGVAALRLFVQAAAPERIVPLVFRRTVEVLDPESRSASILARFGPEVIAGSAYLSVLLSVLLVPVEPVPSEPTVHRLRSALAMIENAPAALNVSEEFERIMLRFLAHRVLRDFETAADLGEKMILVGRRMEGAPFQRRSALLPRLILELVFTDLSDIRLDRSLGLLDMLASEGAFRRQREELTFDVHVIRGDRLLVPRPETDPHPRVALPWGIALAREKLEQGDAQAALDGLRSLEAEIISKDHWVLALEALAHAHLVMDPYVGRDEIDRLMAARKNRRPQGRPQALLNSALADLAMASGEFDHARVLLDETEDSYRSVQITRARMLLLLGSDDAPDSLRELAAQPELWPRFRTNALLLLALFEARRGDHGAADHVLRRAVALAERTGLRTPFMMVPIDELRAVAAHAGVALPENLANPFHAAMAAISLTPREQVVLVHLASADQLSEIARSLHVSLSTVKTQTASVYRKLGVATRAEAVAKGRMRGMIPG